MKGRDHAMARAAALSEIDDARSALIALAQLLDYTDEPPLPFQLACTLRALASAMDRPLDVLGGAQPRQ